MKGGGVKDWYWTSCRENWFMKIHKNSWSSLFFIFSLQSLNNNYLYCAASTHFILTKGNDRCAGYKRWDYQSSKPPRNGCTLSLSPKVFSLGATPVLCKKAACKSFQGFQTFTTLWKKDQWHEDQSWACSAPWAWESHPAWPCVETCPTGGCLDMKWKEWARCSE